MEAEEALKQRFSFPLEKDSLPSKVMDQLEKETGKRVVSLTVHSGEIKEYEVVLGDKREMEES